MMDFTSEELSFSLNLFSFIHIVSLIIALFFLSSWMYSSSSYISVRLSNVLPVRIRKLAFLVSLLILLLFLDKITSSLADTIATLSGSRASRTILWRWPFGPQYILFS